MEPLARNIFGYTDRFSVAPGETLSFHVSCEGVSGYEAAVVRLRHGYTGSAGPGFLETEIPSNVAGLYEGERHSCQTGSCVEISDPNDLLVAPASLVIRAYVYATLPGRSRDASLGAYRVSQSTSQINDRYQAILGTWSEELVAGYALVLNDGKPTFLWGEAGIRRELSLRSELAAHQWYKLEVELPGASGSVQLRQTPVDGAGNRVKALASAPTAEEATAQASGDWASAPSPFRIGALARREAERWLVASPFNGKIGGVGIERTGSDADDSRQVARWHFGHTQRPDGLLLWDVVDGSPNGLHGRCINAPTRGVTGPTFDGVTDDYRLAPDQYDAIHFHEDDIADVDWPSSFTLEVPEDLPSGVYAARLTAGAVQQHVPFFVMPGEAKKDVALLLSTATYLAYANDHVPFEADGAELIVGHTPILHREDLLLQDHPEFGRSCYEIHNDGSGVVFGSVRRPLLTMRPQYRAWFMSEGVWGLAADLCITHWLEHEGCEFDVLTDEFLDRNGYDALGDYRVVITGSHPEYVTRGELDALDRFTSSGGRLMYLGGNGFYATISYDPERPHLMELRRADGGTRPHQSPYGERRHVTSSEMSGLWRNKGRPPQRLAGVGFSAQGFDRSTYYERLEDSRDPRVAFIFDGIGEDERIGDFGIMGGGAAGAEIDCYEPALGAPPDTLVVATSCPLSDNYLLASEEIYEMLPGLGGSEQPTVRSDVVYCTLKGGGGFFSVGSIAWTAALSHHHYENNVAKITANVLRRFSHQEPLDRNLASENAVIA